MFFPEESQRKVQAHSRTVYLFENGKPDQKPTLMNLIKKKSTFKDIAKICKMSQIRIYNSQGSEHFEEDLDFIKHQSVLYVSKGQDFDPASCYAEYEMVSVLGEGGFGKVFLAKHKQTGKKCAIKIIKTQNIGSVNDIDSIFVQAEILKSLKHQNIVQVQKCLTMKNMEVVIIMEHLEGGDLLKYVSALKCLDQVTTRTFIRQVVKGILYCHKNNLTHRDLKLQNLLLVNSEEKKIKIIDFGIAGAISNMKWEQIDTGSLSYMAPECFTPQKGFRFDGKIDVWAIGVILYAMLCGELPFKGQCTHDTIEAIKKGQFKIPHIIKKKMTFDCLDFLHKCLQIDPKERVSTEDLSNHDWLDDGLFNSQQRTEQIRQQYESDPVVQKIKDVSNMPSTSKGQSLDTIVKSKMVSRSTPKNKSSYLSPKKSSVLKAELPKSRFR